MEILVPARPAELKRIYRRRPGERRLGDVVEVSESNWRQHLERSNTRFVIVGCAEDIGVRANYGRPGAYSAFRPALTAFLNQQSNQYLKGDDILVLGEVFTEDLMAEAENADARTGRGIASLRKIVTKLDERVSELVRLIVSVGKIPLIVGGGHNNSYGNICGSSLSLGKTVNVISCDPHLDFRDPDEGRHSGNGFSTAFQNGYLNKYTVVCAHEQHNNEYALQQFAAHPSRLHFETYESVFIRGEITFSEALERSIKFVSDHPCGVELDLDAILNVPSSARTSSGISATQARQFLYACGSKLQPLYLHIAEGAPVLSHLKADIKTGKLIAYLLTDFIKAVKSRSDFYV